ncbi:MAG: sigma 54-interacting transcriptional regulator [bacterium]
MSGALNISYESILESISDGVFTVDLNWNITSFNRAAEKITGISKHDAMGKLCSEVFKSNMCETACALKSTLKNGNPVINKAGYIINADGDKIPVSVSTAVLYNHNGQIIGGAETFRDLSEIESLRKELKGKYKAGDIVTDALCMKKVLDILPAIATSSSTVLIEGETGTGKEIYARAIHNMGKRSEKSFYALNCAAFPDNLLESELFGYKKGAFTGADKDKRGWFSVASNSTLFLDEIGEISTQLQVKLLRVLQENSFKPLGATKSEKTDARIICATNRNLKKLVEAENFREDLFYRINIIKVELPPLRKRISDIPLLVEHFIKKFNRKQDRQIKGVTPEVLSILMAHNWPGNIRELENVIERAFVLCSSDIIEKELLPEELTETAGTQIQSGKLRDIKKLAKVNSITTALKESNYNVPQAAKALGVHKTTIYRIMKKHGISIPYSEN